MQPKALDFLMLTRWQTPALKPNHVRSKEVVAKRFTNTNEKSKVDKRVDACCETKWCDSR